MRACFGGVLVGGSSVLVAAGRANAAQTLGARAAGRGVEKITVSSESDIQVLKELAALDAELAELDGQLNAERDAIASKRALLSELDDRVRLNTDSLQELEKARAQLLGEIRQMSAQIDKAREKLARCRNEREANAVQRELEELRKLYRDREHELEKIVGIADEVKGEVAAASQRRETLSAELGQTEDAASAKIEELERGVAEKRTRRDEIGKRLNQALYRRYELIRKRRGSGLAEAINGSCMACHITLPPMLFQQVMQGGALQQCPSCHRILYYEPAPAESGEMAQVKRKGEAGAAVDQTG